MSDSESRSTDLLAAWLEGKRRALVYACSEKGGKCQCNMCDRERVRLGMIEQVIDKLNELTANAEHEPRRGTSRSAPCSCSPCSVPTDSEQRLDITCAHCGVAIDFRKGEVFIHGPSYVCKAHVANDKTKAPPGGSGKIKSVRSKKPLWEQGEGLFEEERASSCTGTLPCLASQSLRMLLDVEWVLDKRNPVFVLTRHDQTAVVWNDGGVTLV